MPTRREFLYGSFAALASSSAWAKYATRKAPTYVNDIHSQLNRTLVDSIHRPSAVSELQDLVRRARKEKKSISISGGRHAMGGQQFGTDTLLVDTRGLNKVLHLDNKTGLLEAEAGIQWPELIREYLRMQEGSDKPWGIAQKQTGADRICLGGSLACNAHGRGLTLKPLVADVESFVLIDPEGRQVRCSRSENAELFSLAVGGYGLFGPIATVTLRLKPRRKLKRVVEVRKLQGLMSAFETRISDGFLYGDFQFAIDRESDDFLRTGVFSCYQPVPDATVMPSGEKELSDESWRMLLQLAHTDKSKAFDRYATYYLSTNGQLYWSDTHQLSIYPDNYHLAIDKRAAAKVPATEIITEIDVPRDRLEDFLEEVREDFRKNKVDLIYGTVRLIEEDKETVLPWAKKPYACTIFNLHTEHSPQGVAHSADAFRRLIDMAIKRGGNYYLTYHRYARRDQVETCYPRFEEFLRKKREYDPQGIFQSDWYRHYQRMFA